MCKEWMLKGYLNKIWNGVHLEEEEKKEDLEILDTGSNNWSEK